MSDRGDGRGVAGGLRLRAARGHRVFGSALRSSDWPRSRRMRCPFPVETGKRRRVKDHLDQPRAAHEAERIVQQRQHVVLGVF